MWRARPHTWGEHACLLRLLRLLLRNPTQEVDASATDLLEASKKPKTGLWLPRDLGQEEDFPIRVDYQNADGSAPEDPGWDRRPRLLLKNPAHEPDSRSRARRIAFNRRRIAREALACPEEGRLLLDYVFVENQGCVSLPSRPLPFHLQTDASA